MEKFDWKKFRISRIAVKLKNHREAADFLAKAEINGFDISVIRNDSGYIYSTMGGMLLQYFTYDHNVFMHFTVLDWSDYMPKRITITEDLNGVIATLTTNDEITVTEHCRTGDTFIEAAMSALNKISKVRFVPHLTCDGNYCGKIGDETNHTAIFGEKLFVGDVVELYNATIGRNHGECVVLQSNLAGHYIVAPLIFVNGTYGCFQIRKVRSFNDLKHGEIIDCVKVVLQDV